MAGYLVAAVAALAALSILVRLLEPRFAFFPFGGESTTPRDLGLEYESLTISTRDGERLRAWLIPPSPLSTQHLASGTQHRAPPFVVYFHGNGANLSNWAPIVCAIARHGYTVLAFDYRGYGVSTGRPTERGLYADVDAVVDYVWDKMAPSTAVGPGPSTARGPVVYWGRSLGVSMAAYAASRAEVSGPPGRSPAGLILESGFPDARSLFRAPSPMAFLALFSTYRFPAAEYLRPSKLPALVMHGDADSIIPYEQGRALYERIAGPKEFFTIRGADHNDAAPPDARAYWTAINEFIARLSH